jgi:hypothetical protein
MPRLNPRVMIRLAILSVVVALCTDRFWPEARKSEPTIVFMCVTTLGWLIGRAWRLNRPGVWSAVWAVGAWDIFLSELGQNIVAILLPLGALAVQSLPRIRERRVWTMLVGCAATCAVVWLRSSYYLSSELLFLAGVWCVVAGYGLFDGGGDESTAAVTASARGS